MSFLDNFFTKNIVIPENPGNSNNTQNFDSLISQNTDIIPSQSLISQGNINTNVSGNLLNPQTENFNQNNSTIQTQEFLRSVESIKAILPTNNSGTEDNNS